MLYLCIVNQELIRDTALDRHTELDLTEHKDTKTQSFSGLEFHFNL